MLRNLEKLTVSRQIYKMVAAGAAACLVAILSILSITTFAKPPEAKDSVVLIGLKPTTSGIELVLSQDTTEKLVGTIGLGIDFTSSDCIGQTSCSIGDINLGIQFTGDGYEITWETPASSMVFIDCYDLKSGEVNWYGGPERWSQQWPVEKLTLSGGQPYIISRSDNFAVAERYWLNSKGAYIFVDDTAPLYVDQNSLEEGKLCLIAELKEPYINRERIVFKYTIVPKSDPKEAHLHAVNTYLGKPTGHPGETMIRQPIWTTWARYYRNINDEVILNFAQDIIDHGFTGGQLEIDDDWERCYGSQEFKSDNFADISNTVAQLKEQNFRVTLWIHPFVNNDCEDVSSVGLEEGYFVRNSSGSTLATWWNSNDAHQIDFTNPDAADWFKARLEKLKADPGIDSFKFDAGETNYGPQQSLYSDNVDIEKTPNVFTEKYVRTCAEFGDIIEARSAWRTQDLPIFIRMIDKDSHWGDNNGLYTLITTLLQMNMNGYPMVLPDMIGGNGYDGAPSLELLIRWAQANTFMPAMQFSFVPWDIDTDNTEIDGVAIVQKFVQLHEEYSDEIIKAMDASIENGSPVNAPIWWVDPTDSVALATDTEYLLGDSILVAPVIIEGANSRDVYLPRGSWKDGNSDTVYEGPTTINDYPAPIDVLPYFIKQ